MSSSSASPDPGPAAVAAADPAYDFLRRQLDLLGERDPLPVLAATPGRLERLVERHPAAAFAARPAPGKWSGAEVLGHLADTEWIFGFRVRAILAEDRPLLQPADQDRWVARQRHHETPPARSVERLAALRRINLDLWRGLSAEDLARTGRHAGAGIDFSLALLRRVLAGHDLLHLEGLERLLGGAAGDRPRG